MSGGVPKRVLISRTQSNTPSKAGNVMAKNAIVLCNGRRSRRAMCHSVQTRVKYCAKCPTPTKENKTEEALLLINTIQATAGVDDTVLFLYKTPTSNPPLISDDIDNAIADHGLPQNFDSYDDSLYKNIYDFQYSSIDIDLNTMNVGDTYRVILMNYTTWNLAQTTQPGGPYTFLTPWVPPYTTVTSTSLSQPSFDLSGGSAKLDTNNNINYGITSQVSGTVLNIPPVPTPALVASGVWKNPVTITPIVDTFGPIPTAYYTYVIDVTLGPGKTSASHVVV